MSLTVTWYANDKRATVTDAAGNKWWVAPNGSGGYTAVSDEGQPSRSGESLEAVMYDLLGDDARLYLREG